MTTPNDDYKLVAKLGNLKTVVHLLKAVNFKEIATCSACENGLKVTVEDAKCMQATAYLPISVFQEFTLNEDVIFRINLSIFVECLCMYWSSINAQGSVVALQMFYKGNGHPVVILIEEEGIITECSLKTQEPDELLNFNLEEENVLNKIVLQTELLKDVLAELDPSSELIELFLSPDAPFFKIKTDGLAGDCDIEVPHESELIDSFECKETASSCYKLAHIKPAMKALSCGNKVSIRTDDCGLLCFQYMVRTEEGHTCFIEYFISPVVDVND
ncbi:cell cycle checkpoint protein RAD1 [Belonocnema kinseyi]|uniref:cell cycle checkpoint protein RAD1 n=1 Tax=Belonocnema kinseyi TaxID=2817044 RepID=UPI00143DF1AB|nr:cell cycle checkpoint protein RAD1 [Belonocnema kinseyi]XP_033210814.1 cell cycle checkpoint protein RAD1 [Belonocnema kinseyi]XP_033210815.1 cell cycle checkpoint protein RAD1 [Belonocnema kinseyi]